MSSIELPPIMLDSYGPGGVVSRRHSQHVSHTSHAVEVPRRQAVTASAARIKQRDATSYRRLVQPWQRRVFIYNEVVPELNFASQVHANALSKLRLYAGEVVADDPTADPQETDNPVVVDALERVQGPGGGRSQFQAAYGQLRFLTGEGYMLVTLDDDGEEQWEFVSVDELRVQDGELTRFQAPSMGARQLVMARDGDYAPLGEGAVAYRFWKRDPRYSAWATSSVKACMDVLEELVLLTHAVRARARSRAAGAGLLYISDELSLNTVDGEDPFFDDLIQQITSSVEGEGSAADVVPMIVRGPYQFRDGIVPIPIHDARETYPETQLRMECIQRLASGLDMPREVLLGLGDINHWGAWQISEDAWRTHYQPSAQALVDDLTSAYLWPYLKANGVADYKDYRVWYDATDVLVAPDRTGDAKDLHDRIVIGDQALRDAAGFDEDDAPTDDEVARRIGILTRDSGLAITGVPTLRQGSELEPKPGEIEAPPVPGGGVEPPAVGPGNVEKQPPPQTGRPGAQPAQTASADVTARILGAAEMAVERAREAAGNRILSAVQRGKTRDVTLAARLAETPTSLVAAKLGAEATETLVGDASKLTAGANECLTRVLTQTYGVQPLAARMITARVERHAAETLFDAAPVALPVEVVGYVHG